MQPLVSIIMPAYNASRHIAESVQSALAQTYPHWELLVVDDGSTDDTAEVVQGFITSDPRIRYFSRPNGGQAAARNTGLRKASGDLVAFLDADDLWLPEKLESQLAVLDGTGADLVYCDGYVFYDDGSPEQSDLFAVVPGAADAATMLRLLYAYNRIATLSVVVRREALDRVGMFDENRRIQNCEDYDLWIRMARAGCSFYGMPEKLMRYRRHAGSTTYRESRMLRPMVEVARKHADCLDRSETRRKIRERYRDVITALLAEGDITGARESMREFAAWDRRGLVTVCQRILLRLSPGSFKRVSRQYLYPAEWHLTRFTDKLRAA
jgi:teichuronic acid biosynthesis glycosyltransferase TuaG